MKKDNKYSAFYGAIIILFFVMFYMSPYRLDDWTWGSKVGINHLMNHFHGYNGRYFGNIIVLLLLRIPAVFRATIQVVIMILVFKTIRPIMQHNPLQIVLFLCLFLLMPIGVFAQSISWISGFSNFVLSLLLVTHVFSYAVITNTDVATTWEKKLGNAVIVFLGCLVLETATIYIVCILFTTLVYQRILNGNKSSETKLYLLVALLGACLMFSNSSYYHAIAHDGETYKRIIMPRTENLSMVYQVFRDQIIPTWCLKNRALNIILSVTLYALLNKRRKVGKHLSIILFVFFLSDIMAEGWYETNVILHNSVPFLVVAYLAIILYTIMTCVEDKKEKIVLQYAFVSLLFVTLPLLFASPIPSRVYLHSYFFWCILTVVMFRNCGFGEEFFIKKNSALFLRGFLIGYCTFLVCSQGYTWSIYRERDETIKNAISRKSQVILIKKVPLSDMFCYGANIDNDNHKWISYYKQFYGIAEETEVRFVD